MITKTALPKKNADRFLQTLLAGLKFAVIVTASTILLALALLMLSDTAIINLVKPWIGLDGKTPWHISRSAGIVAYLLLAGSTIWGLLLSSKIIKEIIPPAVSLALHNMLSWIALTFSVVHGLVLIFDDYYSYTLRDLAIPFIGPYRPGWVGLGSLSFYLSLLISVSFYFRKQLGQRRWRSLHYLTFIGFILVTLHGTMSGTDSGSFLIQVVYLVSGLTVFFLTAYRLLTRKAGTEQMRQILFNN